MASPSDVPCVYRRSMEICMRVSRIAVYTVYSSTQAESSLDRSSSKDSTVSNYRLGAGVKEIITCLTLFPLFFFVEGCMVCCCMCRPCLISSAMYCVVYRPVPNSIRGRGRALRLARNRYLSLDTWEVTIDDNIQVCVHAHHPDRNKSEGGQNQREIFGEFIWLRRRRNKKFVCGRGEEEEDNFHPLAVNGVVASNAACVRVGPSILKNKRFRVL